MFLSRTISWCVFGAFILNEVAGQRQPSCQMRLPERFSWYPSEWRILLDSYTFDSLGGLWTVVPQGGSFSLQQGVCSSGWLVCSGTEDSWLFTQFINYDNAQEVFFNVSYNFGDCRFFSTCTKQFVTANIYSQSSEAPDGQTDPANYAPLTGSEESSRLKQSDRKPGGFNILSKDRPANDVGFNLGFKDEGTCGSIRRVIVYYKVCPARVSGLVRYSEVSVTSTSAPNGVFQASCISNAHNVTSLDVVIVSANGTCEDRALGGARCECNAGYQQNGSICDACPPGTYRPFMSPATGKCVVCPTNTQRDVAAASQCPCLPGFFRDVPQEGPAVGCTSPPSECRNLRVTVVGERNIVIQWDRPSTTGREDFFYQVSISDPSRPGDYILVTERLVNTASVVSYNITGLVPLQAYQVRVSTHNNVSDQDTVNDPLRICRVSATTREGVPGVVSVVEAFCSVVVWEPPMERNGEIQQYELQFGEGATAMTTNTFFKTTDEQRKSDNSVQVRACTGAGCGEYSISTTLGCSEDMSTPCSVQTTSPPVDSTPPPVETTLPPVETIPPQITCPPPAAPSNLLRFELNGETYLNNTVVIMEDIGEGDDALFCVTDYTSCCSSSGDFFYPNGSFVIGGDSGYDFYSSRGVDLGYVQLNRRVGVACPQGRYQCRIPDSSGQMQSIYIHIVLKNLECPAVSMATVEPTVITCPEPPSCPVCPSPETPAPCNCPTPHPVTPLSCPTCPPPTACPTAPAITEPATATAFKSTEPTRFVETHPEPVTSVVATPSPVPGFYFSLRGREYMNMSVVKMEEIGEWHTGLLCVSENNPVCCDRAGEFYYPNCSRVPINRAGNSLWRNRGNAYQKYIRLNSRPSRSPVSEGVYACEIPYPNNVFHKLYVKIVSKENSELARKKFISDDEIPSCFKW